jgi:hypothetical protein
MCSMLYGARITAVMSRSSPECGDVGNNFFGGSRVPFRTGGKWGGAVIRVKIRGWLPDMAGNLHAQIP